MEEDMNLAIMEDNTLDLIMEDMVVVTIQDMILVMNNPDMNLDMNPGMNPGTNQDMSNQDSMNIQGLMNMLQEVNKKIIKF